jgi:hypothetical protein
MSLALLAAVLAAGAMVAVACILSANRHYHLIHPELQLENSSTVLIVWTTLVAGMIGAGWHFLGWTWLLVGSAGLSSGRVPRFLGGFYLIAGITSLFVYVLPESEGSAGFLSLIVSIWQGILLWRAGPEETMDPKIHASQPDRA